MNDQAQWNEAFGRLEEYVNTFALGDLAQAQRLTLRLFDEARARHQADPSLHPTVTTLRHAQDTLARWFTATLEAGSQPPSQLLANGYTTLLLSRLPQRAPEAFLAQPVAEELLKSMRQTLVIIGPDMQVSSMTPRALDFGPMLDIARQTWHRFNARAFFTALAFWTSVYFLFYWWLSEYL